MIDITIEGKDELESKFKDIESDTPLAMRKAINASALMVKSSAQKSIQRRSPGEAYTRYSPKRTGLASRPGDAPNTDQSTLVKNIKVSTGTSIATKQYTAIVRSQAPHSKPLEFGTADMKARPFMKPALDKNRDKILKMVAQALRGAL